ncbi:hypothetical protein TNCV_4745371 [Trichonephila clavipes]|nr:hypothetical protein TNCV_4745371 [Trichonephila clavipes]
MISTLTGVKTRSRNSKTIGKRKSWRHSPKIEKMQKKKLFSLWSPWKYRCGQRTVNELWHAAKKRPVFAQAHLSKSRTETVKTETLDLRERKRTREVLEQALPSEYHRQTYL